MGCTTIGRNVGWSVAWHDGDIVSWNTGWVIAWNTGWVIAWHTGWVTASDVGVVSNLVSIFFGVLKLQIDLLLIWM